MNPEQWLSLKWNGGSTMSDRWLNQSKIIQEYGDSVFRMCFLYLKDYHLAEDATQGTFMKAMKKLKDYFELHIK